MRKKWLSRFLAATLVVGSLGLYMPVNAEAVQSVEQQADSDGEADSKKTSRSEIIIVRFFISLI